jgi:hypothetical protein
MCTVPFTVPFSVPSLFPPPHRLVTGISTTGVHITDAAARVRELHKNEASHRLPARGLAHYQTRSETQRWPGPRRAGAGRMKPLSPPADNRILRL